MTEEVLQQFRRFREKGWMLKEALRAAKTTVQVRPYLYRGLIRIRVESEQESYWDVYGTDGYTAKDIRCTNQLIEREGLWWACSEVRLTKKHAWEQADSIGMLIGTDDLAVYEPDLLGAALEKLDELFQEDADEMAGRATYAGVVSL